MVRRHTNRPPDKTYICPLCNKIRMVRPHDYEVSYETRDIQTTKGEVLTIPRDICAYCEQKIVNKHFKPSKSDVKKVLQSMEDQTPIDEDKSLEDLL